MKTTFGHVAGTAVNKGENETRIFFLTKSEKSISFQNFKYIYTLALQ